MPTTWMPLLGPMLMLAAGGGPSPATADLVLLGGRIVTLDPARPEARALAVRGDRIAAVGSETEVRVLIGPKTRVLRVDGKLVLPGFIEGHGHFLGLGQASLRLDLRRARSFEEIAALVAKAAAAARPGEWILGRGWHQEKWTRPPEPNVGGLPLHTALSRVSPDNPVLLRHASGHSLIANARAMALAGVTRKTADPPGGQIVRGPDGAPGGVFRETAMDPIDAAHQAALDARSPRQVEADRRRALELAAAECQKRGITSFQDAGAELALVALYRRLVDEGRLGVRLWVMLHENDQRLAAALPAVRVIGYGGGWLTVRAIKRWADGALGSHGAWLLEPYADLPKSRGFEVTPMAAIERSAELAMANDMQLCVHAIGDRANREVLDVYERVFRRHPGRRDLRWRIEHAQHLSPADIPRFGRLGVVASMQGVHCTSDGPWVEKRLGPERAARGAYAWRALLDSGALVSNGSDTPVEDPDPIAAFYALVTRRMADGRAFHPAQRMHRDEALRAMTIDAARAAFEEDVKGSLQPGKLADLVVLSGDILKLPPERIPEVKVLTTVLGGRVVYQRPRPR